MRPQLSRVTSRGEAMQQKQASARRRLGWAASVLLFLSNACPSDAAGFDPEPWRQDYAYLKAQLVANYAHLAWLGSPESGVDLQALDRQARRHIDGDENDAQAAQAIRTFIAGFRDGHLAELPRLEPAPAQAIEPPARDLTGVDPRTACAALGYAHRTSVAFSAPFEALPGFQLTADGQAEPFRAGVLPLADGRRLAVVRIPRFRPQEFPELCEASWSPDRPVSRDQMLDTTQDAWLRRLAERLRGLAARGADTILVDLGGNGGGNDLGDWAVRLFTTGPVNSAPLLMADAPVASGYYDEQLEGLRRARKAAGLTPAAAAILDQASASSRRGAPAPAARPAIWPGCGRTGVPGLRCGWAAVTG